jgi:uncharacterized protein (TIRG00374 family)
MIFKQDYIYLTGISFWVKFHSVMRFFSPRFFFFFSVLSGIAAFICVPILVGIKEVFMIISLLGIGGIFIYCLNSFMILLIPALGWKLLIDRKAKRIPYLSLLKANMMGYPINFLTPSMYLGSEPVRAYYISKTHQVDGRKVLASTIVSKFQEFTGIVLCCFIAACIILFTDALSWGWTLSILAAVGVFVCVVVGLFWIFLGDIKPLERAVEFISRFGIFSIKLKSLSEKAREIDELVRLTFVGRWRIFLLSQLITLLSAISIFVRPAIFYYFTKGEMVSSISTLAVIFVLTQLLLVFQIIPGSLGIFEGGMVGIFALVAWSSSEAVAFSFLTRISDMVMLMSGLWLISHHGLRSLAKKARELRLQKLGE